jgi:hypothetical protein
MQDSSTNNALSHPDSFPLGASTGFVSSNIAFALLSHHHPSAAHYNIQRESPIEIASHHPGSPASGLFYSTLSILDRSTSLASFSRGVNLGPELRQSSCPPT